MGRTVPSMKPMQVSSGAPALLMACAHLGAWSSQSVMSSRQCAVLKRRVQVSEQRHKHEGVSTRGATT
eukprot:scaffold26218_cov189-Isochrysis_galbana.AAC.1